MAGIHLFSDSAVAFFSFWGPYCKGIGIYTNGVIPLIAAYA